MPIPENDEDFPKYGWVKELTYEKILADERLGGRIIVVETDFYANAMRCGSCKSNEYVWIQVPSNHYLGGVLVTCSRCRMTWGPIAEDYASATRRIQITPEQAIAICLRTKQTPPRMLKTEYQQVKAEKVRAKAGRRPRPPKVGE